MSFRSNAGGPQHPGFAAHVLDPARAVHHDFVQGGLAFQQLRKGANRGDPGENVDVAQPQVGIQQEDAKAGARQGNGQVHGNGRLPHSAFSAGDGDHARKRMPGGCRADQGSAHLVRGEHVPPPSAGKDAAEQIEAGLAVAAIEELQALGFEDVAKLDFEEADTAFLDPQFVGYIVNGPHGSEGYVRLGLVRRSEDIVFYGRQRQDVETMLPGIAVLQAGRHGMSDIRFRCPECKGKLIIDRSEALNEVPCPLCGRTITAWGADLLDLRFKCPECQAKLVVDIKVAGSEVTCPRCKCEILVPAPSHGRFSLHPPSPPRARGGCGVPVPRRIIRRR